VIGTIRRECLDWLIPLSESHLRFILKSWIAHYNGGVRTWRWVPEFPIRRTSRKPSRSRLRDIVAENRMPFEPHQSLAGCITNIR